MLQSCELMDAGRWQGLPARGAVNNRRWAACVTAEPEADWLLNKQIIVHETQLCCLGKT